MAAFVQSFQKQDKNETKQKSVVVIYFNLGHKAWGSSNLTFTLGMTLVTFFWLSITTYKLL